MRGRATDSPAKVAVAALAILLSVVHRMHATEGVHHRRTPRPASEIAPYPPMHWHSWNTFTGEDRVNETNMRQMADALLSTGMAEAGYDTVNVVCNGWTSRDPATQELQENKDLWPGGVAAFAEYLHSRNLSLGCYTSPWEKNCCGEPGSLGYEAVDMEFFAKVGCDHIMVDWCRPYENPKQARDAYAVFGSAIANSSNPNMIFGVWSAGIGKSWKWAADVGGHYWRTATDIYNAWERPVTGTSPFWQGSGSVLHNFDMAFSIPSIDRHTTPGHYTFLDQMVLGVVPGHGIQGPGLSFSEAQAHMTMWVMAATPLLTCNDVRSMPDDIKGLLTNPEVLAVHKDPLARMASRIDVGGGVEESHSGWSQACASNYSIYGKPLADGSTAAMILNRGTANTSVVLLMEDVGDSMHTTYGARDLWLQKNISASPIVDKAALEVPGHGVRFLRLWPMAPAPPPPPPPAPKCPADFAYHAPGFWSNTDPCPDGNFTNCTEDHENSTMPRCATKCRATEGCVGFEVNEPGTTMGACYIFLHSLSLPFTPVQGCFACVKKVSVGMYHPQK